MLGAATSFHLTKLGARVVCIDGGPLGGSATARSAGLLLHASSPSKASSTAQTLRDIAEMDAVQAKLGSAGEGPVGFVKTGMVRVASDQDELDRLKLEMAMVSRGGVFRSALVGDDTASVECSSLVAVAALCDCVHCRAGWHRGSCCVGRQVLACCQGCRRGARTARCCCTRIHSRIQNRSRNHTGCEWGGACWDWPRNPVRLLHRCHRLLGGVACRRSLWDAAVANGCYTFALLDCESAAAPFSCRVCYGTYTGSTVVQQANAHCRGFDHRAARRSEPYMEPCRPRFACSYGTKGGASSNRIIITITINSSGSSSGSSSSSNSIVIAFVR